MNKNSIGFGALVGIILPIVGFGLLLLINLILQQFELVTKNGEIFQISEKTRVITAICLNLFPFQYSQRKRWDYMLRGCGIVTLFLALGWAWYYGLLGF